MKLTLDPMPALRMVAKGKVNTHFNNMAQAHCDAAYTMKRSVAASGAPFPDWFTQEADLRGITPAALACLILSKPDTLVERELNRQGVMAEIAAAGNPVELETILDRLNG